MPERQFPAKCATTRAICDVRSHRRRSKQTLQSYRNSIFFSPRDASCTIKGRRCAISRSRIQSFWLQSAKLDADCPLLGHRVHAVHLGDSQQGLRQIACLVQRTFIGNVLVAPSNVIHSFLPERRVMTSRDSRDHCVRAARLSQAEGEQEEPTRTHRCRV
jgi:hypothetical protein